MKPSVFRYDMWHEKLEYVVRCNVQCKHQQTII